MASLAEDLLGLVRIDSVTGREAALAGILETRLRDGPASRFSDPLRIGDSLVLSPRRRDRKPLVVLAGHLDTVPAGGAPEPQALGTRVLGRGSVDMKAGLAIMLALAEDLPPDSCFADRAYVFYCGEEGPAEGNDLARILQGEPWLRRADLAVLLEPTGGYLELGCLGTLHLEVSFPGRACHSARPWLGEHPLRGALPWLAQILEHPIRAVETGGVVFKEVVSLTTLHAGESRNVVPGVLRANVNFRYGPDRTPEDAERFARGLCPSSPGVECRRVDHAPPGAVPRNAPLYRHLIESSGLPCRAKQAWTDVARFSQVGVPALNWGPGDPHAAHTNEESIEVSDLEETLARMREFFLGPGPDLEGDA